MSVRCSLGHDNPDGSAFCDECGEPLTGAAPAAAAPQQAAPSAAPAEAGTQVCPSCGAVNPAGEAFCSNCGVSLLGAPAPVAVNAVPAPTADHETQPAVAPQAASVATGAPASLQARLIVEA